MKINKLINHVILILIIVLCSLNPTFAQEESKIETDFGIDLASRYVWRGTQFGGASPSIQPYIEVGLGNLVLGTWGAYSLGGANPAQELDLYLSYSLMDDQFSITITDYYFPADTGGYNYFNYEDTTTGHIFEAMASFNGTDKMPFSALVAMNVYGADATRISDDLAKFNMRDGIQFSTYLELGYSTTCKIADLDFFVGVNLTKPRPVGRGNGYVGESGFYGHSVGVVNIGVTASKEIQITDKFSLPLMAQLITNPQAQKIFMVFGFSL